MNWPPRQPFNWASLWGLIVYSFLDSFYHSFLPLQSKLHINQYWYPGKVYHVHNTHTYVGLILKAHLPVLLSHYILILASDCSFRTIILGPQFTIFSTDRIDQKRSRNNLYRKDPPNSNAKLESFPSIYFKRLLLFIRQMFNLVVQSSNLSIFVW